VRLVNLEGMAPLGPLCTWECWLDDDPANTAYGTPLWYLVSVLTGGNPASLRPAGWIADLATEIEVSALTG